MNTLPFSQRPTESPRAGHRGRRDDGVPLGVTRQPDQADASTPARSRWVALAARSEPLTGTGLWIVPRQLCPRHHRKALRIESEPAGAAVEVDGALRGLTPLTVDPTPGAHAVVVSHEGQTQEIAANVTQGRSDAFIIVGGRRGGASSAAIVETGPASDDQRSRRRAR